MPKIATHPRPCPLCVSTCGFLFTLEPPRLLDVEPSPADSASGQATWDAASAEIDRRLPALVNGDPGSCAVYQGNSVAHRLDSTFNLGELIAALGVGNIFSSGSVDTWPKSLAPMQPYGTDLGLTLPDIHLDRLPAKPWLEPTGVERIHDDRTGRAGTVAETAGARRHPGRGGPGALVYLNRRRHRRAEAPLRLRAARPAIGHRRGWGTTGPVCASRSRPRHPKPIATRWSTTPNALRH